ncbi:hypothetical protein M378DRAFT_166935 [Amanita muscaria Koide BX008]|uniref:Uncharacterized protein n=1 Tax=Amanita muscaria (strain Koide BX008) TaxID=946122 RepID=A0A0C2WIX5_AMAMK|nr:hypothetical protein M378DRAFT_166935 [Amanita muscaria Koide BX008]
MDTPLISLEACGVFLNTQTPSIIAARLLRDQSICRSESPGTPSLLVYCLPAKADNIAREISKDIPNVPIAIARMRYSNIIAGIKSHLSNLQRNSLDGDDRIPAHMIPSNEDFHAALKVLRYLQLPQVPVKLGGLDHITDVIQSQLDLGPQLRENLLIPTKKSQVCYICRFRYTRRHRLYSSLCHPCGEFNISSSALSLPSNLNLNAKTAVVTGGRINLGYHTALRLLRCGAHVIVSTRYPHDAEERYINEPDASDWRSRLRIIGADFRSAKDVFAFVKAIVECLQSWGKTKLDILINNAAQTLTDSVEKEEQSIHRELLLTVQASNGSNDGVDTHDGNGIGDVGMVQTVPYVPRVRGGQSDRLLISNNAVLNPERPTSSWVQRISEIPYEDVISAHSVNTFVPFILIRELLPFMNHQRNSGFNNDTYVPHSPPKFGKKSAATGKPAAYIINVSSREGLPERRRQAKDGHHVHTNMSKAALNMLTETEATKTWRSGRVALNAVDPGYMSADPVWMKMVGRDVDGEQETPLKWEDGVGRVLWIIAKGETELVPIWGKFLKHFVEIDPRR